MRKIINILFAALYLFLTTGFTVTLHFCGGVVNNISFVRTYGDKDPCGCGKSACENPCCKDEVQTIKLSDTHKFEAKFNQNSFELIIALVHSENFLPNSYNNLNIVNTNSYTDSSPPELYLYNRTLLI